MFWASCKYAQQHYLGKVCIFISMITFWVVTFCSCFTADTELWDWASEFPLWLMCDQHSPTQGHLNYYAWKRGKGAMMSHFNQRRQLESFTTFCLCLEGHKGSGLSLHTAKSHFAVGCIITQELFHTPQKRRMLYHHCKTKLNQFVLAWVEHYTRFFFLFVIILSLNSIKMFSISTKIPNNKKR